MYAHNINPQGKCVSPEIGLISVFRELATENLTNSKDTQVMFSIYSELAVACLSRKVLQVNGLKKIGAEYVGLWLFRIPKSLENFILKTPWINIEYARIWALDQNRK